MTAGSESASNERDYEEEANLETGTHADGRSSSTSNQHSLAPLGGDSIWRQGRTDRTR